jgi:hypothetical protein
MAPNLDTYIDVATRIADFREKYPEGSLQPANPAEPFRIVQVDGEKKDGQRTMQTFIVYTAAAYRDREDTRPGIGMAWEIWPGRTPYTLGSELMNAETSAWGRAIIAVGASDSRHGVASREEVENAAERIIADERAYRALRNQPPEVDADGAATQAELTRVVTGPEPGTVRLAAVPADDPWYDSPKPLADVENPEDRPGTASAEQLRSIGAKFTAAKIGQDDARRTCSEIVGRRIGSRKDLSYSEAGKVLEKLG